VAAIRKGRYVGAAEQEQDDEPFDQKMQRLVAQLHMVAKRIVQQPAASLPSDYAKLLEDLKSRIRTARVEAALAVNCELVLLYWDIVRSILERQQQEGWGAKVIERLADDLRREFPDMKGLSLANLFYMRAFAEAYPDREFVQQVAGQLPWFHNVTVLTKVKDPLEREWYLRACTEHGWSRAVLLHQIESGLYHRQERALTNFARTLPAPQSELAQQLLKDPYNFDFLSTHDALLERDLHKKLVEHLRDFMVELGVGFAFVGSQVHLEVGGEDFYLDLLFYHLKLRCFVVVEYTLRDVSKPLGVAEYRLSQALPAELRSALPSVEELEAELAKLDKENLEELGYGG
jgi:predicted nuclease of restriction endonuclease-like (RecB) superfamily